MKMKTLNYVWVVVGIDNNHYEYINNICRTRKNARDCRQDAIWGVRRGDDFIEKYKILKFVKVL
jgi:hypothetical protein